MHLYSGKDYQKALQFNLASSRYFFHFYDFNLALLFLERVMVCAEKVNNNDELAYSYAEKGRILLCLFKFSKLIIAYRKSLKIASVISDKNLEVVNL